MLGVAGIGFTVSVRAELNTKDGLEQLNAEVIKQVSVWLLLSEFVEKTELLLPTGTLFNCH